MANALASDDDEEDDDGDEEAAFEEVEAAPFLGTPFDRVCTMVIFAVAAMRCGEGEKEYPRERRDKSD